MIVVRVGPEAFDAGAEIAALGCDGVGAVASFTGFVRGDAGVIALTLEHYSQVAEAALRRLAKEASARWALGGVVLHHRVGRLAVGEAIVFVATAAPHRQGALEACAFLIDRLKTDAPFWKRESYADGRERWVEAGAGDDAAAAHWDQTSAR